MRSYRYPSYLEKAAIEFQSSEFGVGCYIRTNLRGKQTSKGYTPPCSGAPPEGTRLGAGLDIIRRA
jgi:hypothetical protein